MPHRRLAAPDCLGDLRDRHSCIHQGFQLRACEPAFSDVLAMVNRLESMLLDPATNRRFMPPKSMSNLRQGETLTQKQLKRSAIHAPYCLAHFGWNDANTRSIL